MIDRHIKRLDKSIADLKKLGELAQQTFMLTIQLEALVEMGKSDFLAEYFSDWAQVSNSLLRFWSKSNHMIAQSTDAQGLPFGATSACQVAVVINETLMTLLSVTASLDKLKKPVPRGFLLNKDMLTSRLRDVWKRNSIRYYPWLFCPPFKGWASLLGELSRRAQTEVAESCRALEREYRSDSSLLTENVTKKSDSVILFHGDRQYSIGQYEPITLTENEDRVFQSFLEQQSMGTDQLVNRTKSEFAAKTLRLLMKKYQGRFAKAITTPGVKGKGGYQVNIQNVRMQSK